MSNSSGDFQTHNNSHTTLPQPPFTQRTKQFFPLLTSPAQLFNYSLCLSNHLTPFPSNYSIVSIKLSSSTFLPPNKQFHYGLVLSRQRFVNFLSPIIPITFFLPRLSPKSTRQLQHIIRHLFSQVSRQHRQPPHDLQTIFFSFNILTTLMILTRSLSVTSLANFPPTTHTYNFSTRLLIALQNNYLSFQLCPW